VPDEFLKKKEAVKELFRGCVSREATCQKIIELGKGQCGLDPCLKTEENRVQGCQSRMYLHATYDNGRIYYTCESDALISAGLGMLLVKVYSGELPETIIKERPSYIEELHIPQTLTPSRANGLASIYIRMKQDAMKFLLTPGGGS
jgi:cysteine desulfuration protein SufE